MARWIKFCNQKQCDQCGFYYYSAAGAWPFCPNCGAKMEGVTYRFEEKEDGKRKAAD